jgi:hypothetical protein
VVFVWVVFVWVVPVHCSLHYCNTAPPPVAEEAEEAVEMADDTVPVTPFPKEGPGSVRGSRKVQVRA